MKRDLESIIQSLSTNEKQILFSLRNRIQSMIKTYGDLAKAGRSPFESIEEIAIIYKLLKYKVSYAELGRFLGVSKVSVFRWKKAIDKGEIAIYDISKGVTIKTKFTIDKLEEIIKELSKARAKKHLENLADSKVIQEFLKKPIAIQRSKKRYYTQTEINEVLKAFSIIVDYIKKHEEELRVKYEMDIPSNPDLWAENRARFEEIISDIVFSICLEKDPSKSTKFNQCKAFFFGKMKKVMAFRNWFQGMIGRVTNRINPKESTLYLDDLKRFRDIAKYSEDPELQAFYWIAVFHMSIGSREGWGSIVRKVEELKAEGIKIPPRYEKPLSLDLDDNFVDSSLIGVKWDNVLVDPRNKKVLEIKIYERKTKKWAIARYIDLFDPDLPHKLYEFYEFAKKENIRSVVKAILYYYRVFGNKKEISIFRFKRWYEKKCRSLQEMLNLPYKITPHRLRSAHVSILAELRIPMELVLDHNTGFGVGWEDLTTAKIFYLRFSQRLIGEYLSEAYKRVKEILA